MVATTDATAPSSAWIGVALTSVVTLRPSGVVSTISWARTVSALLSALASGNSPRAISRPSAKRQVRIPSRSSAGRPGMRRLSTMRLASRLSETGAVGAQVEHHDAHRRGLDQRLEVGAGAALGAVGPRVGDGGRGLGGEQHQDLLVLVGERLAALLLDKIEVADMDAAMAHRRALESLRRHPVGGEAELLHIGRDVGDPDRPRQVAEVLEEPRPVGPFRQPPVLLLG